METDNLNIIQNLVADKEGGKVEFKQTTGQLERGMKTLCAFLNGEGGAVLFGVKDNGAIIGQVVSDKTKREIAEAIRLIEPFAAITVSYADIPGTGRQVIALYAEEQRYMSPFTYKGRAYQRIESVTSVMPQDKYNHLLMQRGGKYSWEAMPNPDLHISDLDENAIIGAVRAGINCGRLPESTIREEIPAILEKFDLLHDGKLNNAAAVLFGRNLYDYPQCLLRMARFRGTGKEEFMDNQRLQGNIYELLDAAMSFFFKHLSLSGKIEGLMTLEKLLGGHSSEPPNLIIANVLYKSELLESWGRGIRLMIDECRRACIPDPEFHTDGSSVWVVFRYKLETAGQAPDKHPTSTRQAPDKYPASIVRLIEMMGEQTYSLKEQMELMELKDRENFLDNYLNPSMEAGLVEPLYPSQPKHPKQKYRLTEQGRALLQEVLQFRVGMDAL